MEVARCCVPVVAAFVVVVRRTGWSGCTGTEGRTGKATVSLLAKRVETFSIMAEGVAAVRRTGVPVLTVVPEDCEPSLEAEPTACSYFSAKVRRVAAAGTEDPEPVEEETVMPGTRRVEEETTEGLVTELLRVRRP